MPFNTPRSAPPCQHCHGACCREGSGWKHACWLNDNDLKQPDIKAKAVWYKAHQTWVLPYKNGKCVFLDGRTNQCKIYYRRPEVCRTFNCRECIERNRFIIENPLVAALLRDHPNKPVKNAS